MGDFKDALFVILLEYIAIFDNHIQTAVGILTLNSDNAVFEAALDMARDISHNVIRPTATSIIAICFFIEFMKLSLKMDMFKWEYGVSALAKFAVAKAALDIAPDFVMAIYARGTQWIMSVNETMAFGLVGDAHFVLDRIRTDATWLQALAVAVTMSIIFLGVMVIGVFVVVMAYARMFEILIYISVAPLPVAFLPLENSGVTKRFALNFAAVVLQGVIMLIIIRLYNTLSTALFDGLRDKLIDEDGDMWFQIVLLLGTMLMSTLTLTVAIMKSSSIAKSILGQG